MFMRISKSFEVKYCKLRNVYVVERANKLTQTWKDKWQEAHDIIKESDLSIRGLNKRTSSMGVLIESQLPHLVGMDDDILSTGVMIYHLKEGKTLIGRDDAAREQDIGDYILLGKTNMFRFNNPAEAAKLRERRESQEGILSGASSLSSLITEDNDNIFLRIPRPLSMPRGMNQQLERRFDSEGERIEEASYLYLISV
ncbi:hypothetical protein KUTeg_014016 [Tegillarca granosa]|uniref:Uncharacterized protein n=1 Tax=Tegillarca granosa TaxID=220873 RepID=A0ABQ9EVD5_TEGGR|nr:hypothetical protein KUTeg_014016 [Tegillarca granosa]